MTIKDGGPAFPVTPTDNSGQIGPTEYGMSLRDWFAGKAISGIWADGELKGSYDDLAEHAYEQADAMLRAKEDRNES